MRRFLLLAAAAVAAACAHPALLTNRADPRFTAAAPDSFDVRMVTTKGTMLVRVRRRWAPLGADRFYALVRNRYFDSVAFHRVVPKFVAQFGIHGDPAVNAAWRGSGIADDTIRVVNQRGTLAFARGGPNSRSTQLFFNLVDNTPRLDHLNDFGFPPIGQVIRGLDVLDRLNSEYSGPEMANPPNQDSITRQGNAYLRRQYPRLDYITNARIVQSWRSGK
jgi:cyclophilin family peptidyl-prolyl cis-trans isomerase